MAELRLAGRSASPGLFAGPVYRLASTAAARRTAGAPEAERAALAAALAQARADVAALAATAGGEAAEILGFQVALLEDEALAEPAYEQIDEGAGADVAWAAAMDAEIASYQAAGDEYFRARAADLEDIKTRVLDVLAGRGGKPAAPAGAVLAARDLEPSRFLSIDWSKGGAILLSEGSPTSHVAMLARARGVPMIVGLGPGLEGLDGEALVDAGRGEVIAGADDAERARFAALSSSAAEIAEAAAAVLLRPALTADGTRIATLINIADPDEVDALDPAICDGVGLVRTEFLFHGRQGLPDEETQLAAYAKILRWAADRPVTIRTLDAGGDKPIEGLTLDGESNPFLGLRGIRLSLKRPDVFRVQLRALARAAVAGNLKVMLPMVAVPAELEAARALLDAEIAALAAAGVAHARPPLGIMVEVPAAALAPERFDAAFFSIGSNDLTQYVMAAGRDAGAVADLADVREPAVLRLIGEVAAHGRSRGIEVSLCGDAGGDPAVIPELLAAGLTTLSCAPALLGRAKLAIAAVDLAAPRR